MSASSYYASVWTQVDGKNVGLVLLGPHSQVRATELAESMKRVGYAVLASFSQALGFGLAKQSRLSKEIQCENLNQLKHMILADVVLPARIIVVTNAKCISKRALSLLSIIG